MNKKKILLLVGGVAVIVIVAVGTQYLAMVNDKSKDVAPQEELIEEVQQSVFTADSYFGTVQSIDKEKIVITKEDGSTEEYSLSSNMYLYDNRVRDAMKPITFQDLDNGMSVQVSHTVNETENISSTVITLQ